MADIPYKIYLTENEMPQFWMNLAAYMPNPAPPMLDPVTFEEVGREALEKVFTKEAVEQELNVTDKLIEIPHSVREFYRMYRPSPVVRAYNLEKALGTNMGMDACLGFYDELYDYYDLG